jgi:hypothetical protein
MNARSSQYEIAIWQTVLCRIGFIGDRHDALFFIGRMGRSLSFFWLPAEGRADRDKSKAGTIGCGATPICWKPHREPLLILKQLSKTKFQAMRPETVAYNQSCKTFQSLCEESEFSAREWGRVIFLWHLPAVSRRFE